MRSKKIHSAPLSYLSLLFCAFLVGLLAGIGAMIFRQLLSLAHNLFFAGKFDFFYDADFHTLPSIWGIGVRNS